MTRTTFDVTTLGMTPELTLNLTRYLNTLNATSAAYTRDHFPNLYAEGIVTTFDVDPGARRAGRFFRIAKIEGGRATSVHAFIERATGAVVKPAGWAGPAKSTAKATRGALLSRYSLAAPVPLLDAVSVPGAQYGGYLYA